MTTQSITSDQRKQFKRFVEDASDRALKEFNPSKDALQRLFGRGGEFQEHVMAGIKQFSAKIPDYNLARTILGNDFVSPEEVSTARTSTIYTEAQLTEFERTLPSKEELEWLRDNGFMLVPGPSQPMSTLEIRDLKNGYFYSKTEGWYSNDKERFSRDDKVTTKWLKIRKGSVPNSFDKNWSEQEALVSGVEYVPNAAEVCWAVTAYKAVRNIYLLPGVYVRTSSLDSDGRHVLVEGFGAGGLGLDHWGDGRVGSIGVASARK